MMNTSKFEKAMFQILSFPRSVRDCGGYWRIGGVDGYVTIGKESGIVRAHFRMREDKGEDMKEYKHKHNELPPDDWKLDKENCHRKIAEYLGDMFV